MQKGKAATGRLETLGVVLAWFALNIAMGVSTKWIFLYGQICNGAATECRTFQFPLSITIIHMAFSCAMCRAQLMLSGRWNPSNMLSASDQLQKIAPLAVCFSLSVAFGNCSLKYIYPSFNQMLGAMSPVVTVAIAVLMGKRYNAWTWGSMPIISGGLALCSGKEINFNAVGASFAVASTILRAVKSLMQGSLLTGADKLDSVTLLYYMAPWAAGFLFLMAIFVEGTAPLELLLDGLNLGFSKGGGTYTGGWNVVFLLLLSGMNACLLNVANFSVTAYTSPLTLQVLGNVKSCLAIATSVAVFHNQLLPSQVFGVGTCLGGVWLYNQKGAAMKVPILPGPTMDKDNKM